MACMCGDLCCGSCGPAQGNWRCIICGQWASEGCRHIRKTGRNADKTYLKRYQKQADHLQQQEAEAERQEEEARVEYRRKQELS